MLLLLLSFQVMVTYNGDFFDWPYVDKRCKLYDISLRKEIGISSVKGDGVGEEEYLGHCVVHLDAFAWVKRDSYLPQGTQGLKSVTKNKCVETILIYKIILYLVLIIKLYFC